VQEVVLILPAVDPAGRRSSSSAGGAGGGRAMQMLLQLVAPKSQSPQGHAMVGGFKAVGDTPWQGTGGWGSDRLREAGVEERRRWGGRSPEVRCLPPAAGVWGGATPMGTGEARLRRRDLGWDWEFGMTDE